jgi:hypothetical protein
MLSVSSLAFLLLLQVSTTSAVWQPVSVVVEEWSGGTNAVTEGVGHTFTGLDPRGITPYYLRVEIMPTDMDSDYENIAILVNEFVIDSCEPMEYCKQNYYTCVDDFDVTTSITSVGNLEVKAMGSSQIDNICSYEGYNLYVRYTILTLMLNEVWEGGKKGLNN